MSILRRTCTACGREFEAVLFGGTPLHEMRAAGAVPGLDVEDLATAGAFSHGLGGGSSARP